MKSRRPHSNREPEDPDDRHDSALDIISGDNHYPVRPLHPSPFAATISPSSAFWPSWFGRPPIISYSLLTDPDWLALLLPLQPDHVDKDAGLTSLSNHSDLIDDAFNSWETYSNLQFEKTTEQPAQVNIVGFTHITPLANNQLTLGHSSLPSRRYEFFTPVSFIALNTKELKRGANSRFTVLHEIGHAVFGLQHPFEVFFFPDPGMFLTSFSVMNYVHETTPEGKKIIPYTPMPFDIEAAQRLYGAKPVNTGNNTYILQELLPAGDSATDVPIMALPYDHGGSDTISAAGFKGKVTINLRPYGRSIFPEGYFVMPPMDDIEHVVGGLGENIIFLNKLDNGVDVRAAKGSTTIVFDTKHGGHDTVFGFNPKKDLIIIQSADGKFLPKQLHGVREKGCLVIADKAICHQGGTVITFDHDSTLLLADVKPDEIKDGHFKPITDEVILEHKIALLAEFSHYPKEFFNDFSSALAQGAAFTFITTLNEDYMKARGCSESHIARAGLIINALMTFYTGSVITSSAALVTSNIMSYLGFSSQTANIASTVVATGINAAQNFSLIGAARMATAMIGSYAGSRFTLWARGKAKQKWQQQRASVKAPHQMI